jgi:formylmethanofuran dehydrogenase subunit E
MPGPTRYKKACSRCGQVVRDHREVIEDGCAYCKPCADGVYFKNAKEITWPDMNWVPDKRLT